MAPGSCCGVDRGEFRDALAPSLHSTSAESTRAGSSRRLEDGWVPGRHGTRAGETCSWSGPDTVQLMTAKIPWMLLRHKAFPCGWAIRHVVAGEGRPAADFHHAPDASGRWRSRTRHRSAMAPTPVRVPRPSSLRSSLCLRRAVAKARAGARQAAPGGSCAR